jgi:hypothetical protein
MRHPDELREIFDTPGVYFIGVNVYDRPADIPSEYPFYSVPIGFFSYFDLKVVPGVYVYRSADRNLIKASRKPAIYLRSAIVDIALVDVTERPYFGGYFVDESRDFSAESAELQDLARRHQNAFFSLFSGATADSLATRGGLLYLEVPLFVVFKSGSPETDHWVLKNASLIPEILSGNVPFIHASGPKVNQSTLTYDDFDAVVNSTKGDKLVLFLSKGVDPGIASVFRTFERKVKTPNLHYFSYDLTRNEVPARFCGEEPRAIALFPDGRDMVPFDGDASMSSLLHFALGEATHPFPYPEPDDPAAGEL